MKKAILVCIRSWSADDDASDALYHFPPEHYQTLLELLGACKHEEARVLVEHHGLPVTPGLTFEIVRF